MKQSKLKVRTAESKVVKTNLEDTLKNPDRIVFEGVYKDPNRVVPKKVLFVEKKDESKRTVKNTRLNDSYTSMSQLQQMYHRPQTFIGTIDRENRTEEIFNFETNKFETSTVEMPYAMKHLLMELITNAADNIDCTRRADEAQLPVELAKKLKKVGKIQTKIDSKRISVRNQGLPIPIIPSDKMGGDLIPVGIFGKLNSSSNYDDGEFIRTGAGVNGFGAKLTSVFSTYFRVKAGDPINGQIIDIIWTGNMTEISYLKCSPGYQHDGKSYIKDEEGNFLPNEGKRYEGEPYVEVEYQLDFERFGYTEYPEEAIGIFANQILFLGMSSKIVVSINDVDYDVRNIRNFAKMKFGEEACRTSIIHYEWPVSKQGRSNVSVIPARFSKMTQSQLEKAIVNPESPDEIPMVELIALDTPDTAVVISGVNGQGTPEGGPHVTESLKSVTSAVLDEINSSITVKTKKGKQADESKDVKIQQLTIASVREHISLIVSCRLFDTKYTSQTKTKLSSPKPVINIDQKTLEKVKKWRLIERLYEEMQSKINKALKKTNGKKAKHISSGKGEDANKAGTKESLKCVLYWAEGDSATSYPKQRILLSPGGNDYGGYFPGKGKMINICSATPNQLVNNEDIRRLKQFTGIFEGIDVTIPADLKKLRYGLIVIATDADKDGAHIRALRINYFYRRFPSLIQQGMVAYLETPYARALKGKGAKEKCLQIFRNEQQLNEWLEANSSWFTVDRDGHSVKYYKGLAGSRDSDIEQDLKTAPVIVVLCDDLTEQSLDIAFKPGNSNLRKKWIETWRKATGVQDVKVENVSTSLINQITHQRSITTICNHDLVDYSKETYLRSLPSKYDGFKESQRKGLYASLVHWSFGNGRAGSMKTDNISRKAAQLTSYHYNGNCLSATFTKQAQSFTGSNNMAYFTPEGQLGSKHKGGKDAGDPRYTSVDIAPWIKYVYLEEFLKVIPFRVSEGSKIEPEWLPGVIPMHLVNGFLGIATGYSTFGPNHNPYDVINWLVAKCNGIKEPPHVHPWYIDYNGVIEVSKVDWTVRSSVISSGNKSDAKTVSSELLQPEDEEEEKEDTDDEEVDDEEKALAMISKETTKSKNGPSMKTYGVFEKKGTTVRVTDLPIGVWSFNYKKMWEKNRDDEIIEDIEDKSTINTIDLVITGHKTTADYKELKLVKSYTLANMVLIDNEGYPTRYKNTQEILHVYYANMIDMFDKLKQVQIQECKDSIFDIEQRLLFIQAHEDGKIVIYKTSKATTLSQMAAVGVLEKYYNLMKMSDCSSETLEELKRGKDAQISKMQVIISTSPESMWLVHLIKLEKKLKKMKICIMSSDIDTKRVVTTSGPKTSRRTIKIVA